MKGIPDGWYARELREIFTVTGRKKIRVFLQLISFSPPLISHCRANSGLSP